MNNLTPEAIDDFLWVHERTRDAGASGDRVFAAFCQVARAGAPGRTLVELLIDTAERVNINEYQHVAG